MKKALLLSTVLSATVFGAMAVATNYSLRLDSKSEVYCGPMAEIDASRSYTVQLWFNADSWTEGAQLLSLGNGSALTLGAPGKLDFGGVTISSDNFKAASWIQLTIISDDGCGKVLVNGIEAATPALPAICAATDVTIGGSFEGRIDELRIWSAPLEADFDYFVNNTLNRWVPQADDLVAYYKFDQQGCNAVVDYTALWNPERTTNHHGEIRGNAMREVISDNPVMRYRVNGAYTANERFFDRAIPREQYLVSNDIIILGIDSYADGHLAYSTPCDHAANNGVQYLAEFEGRSGVASFDGSSTIDAGATSFAPADRTYTAEAQIYIEQWTEGAEVFSILNEAGDKGISLSLGEEANHHLVVTLDGHRYTLVNKISAGKWHHVAICPNPSATDDGRFTFKFFVDGTEQTPGRSTSDSEVFQVPTLDSSSRLVVGRNFKGKMDNVAFWYRTLDASLIKGHATSALSMPGIGKTITADFMRSGRIAYMFDKSDNLGYDSYSQDEWLAIMRSAYEGYSGYEIRISVKSHTNWTNTIADAGRRKIFAADLAELSKPYDGVELDLEWMYGTQTNLGLLAEEIRNALPQDKSFMVSCHNVAYGFPHDKMQYCDGFTFQQYGPQKVHFGYSHFEQMCDKFIDYGFPAEKIVTSYSTTTSSGHKNGTADVQGHPIKGLRNGFLDDYTPKDVDSECKEIDGYNYYYTSPRQTYRRARHTVENGFGGIFYWDMGNDVPFEHPYNAAKWCSYALNSNVEPAVTHVEINHPASTGNVAAVSNSRAQMTLRRDGDTITVCGIESSALSVCDCSGRPVLSAEGNSTNVAALGKGIYVATATATDGSRHSAKFSK